MTRSLSLLPRLASFSLIASACVLNASGQTPAQEPAEPGAVYDRGLPPRFDAARQAWTDAGDDRPLAGALEQAETQSELAKARAEAQRLELENLRLRMSLQELQLRHANSLLTLSAPDVANRPDEARALGRPQAEANILRDSVWHIREIPVHWENPTEADAEERQWVREAIEATWQKESALKFVGWDQAENNSRGIRIQIADAHPHCKRLGRHLDGLRNGMVLNFEFGTWCPACRLDRKGAIQKIAIHEFGHALGFAHEQNREDAPDWCRLERQGTDGDWYITLYDPTSIMNYCNPDWNNDGKLSELDIYAIRVLYGVPLEPDPDNEPEPPDDDAEE